MIAVPAVPAAHIGCDDMKPVIFVPEEKRVAAALRTARLRNDLFIPVQRGKMIAVFRHGEMNAFVFGLVPRKIAKKVFAQHGGILL
jgi:hypothetical protein